MLGLLLTSLVMSSAVARPPTVVSLRGAGQAAAKVQIKVRFVGAHMRYNNKLVLDTKHGTSRLTHT